MKCTKKNTASVTTLALRKHDFFYKYIYTLY